MTAIDLRQLDEELSRNPIEHDPDDGLPAFPDLAKSGLKLSPDERLVLGQIVQFNGRWSIENILDLHKQIIDGFASESGYPYDPAMGQAYIAPIKQALESLSRQGLVEPVPGQSTTDQRDPTMLWQKKN